MQFKIEILRLVEKDAKTLGKEMTEAVKAGTFTVKEAVKKMEAAAAANYEAGGDAVAFAEDLLDASGFTKLAAVQKFTKTDNQFDAYEALRRDI